MDELIKKLAEERDEWRDKFHALNQTAGELCNACGWAFKIPGESCRCEVIKERDEARANYQWMVNRACDEKLDGYRELGAKCAQLEEERDEARAKLYEANLKLDQAYTDAERLRKERDDAIRRITEVGVMVATNGNLLAKDAYRRGAEAMREACAEACRPILRSMASRAELAKTIRALPIPEEK
jgi:hypothetical protein